MTLGIQIRPFYKLSEMASVVDLQREYWGQDGNNMVPAHVLFSIANYGGHVLVAKTETQCMGAVIGWIGTDHEVEDRLAMTNLLVFSKRMIVRTEYRSQNIGYQLKIAQRNWVMKQGIRLITWTFDPLLTINAKLNVSKLGGICPTYYINYYDDGQTLGLGQLRMPTDRLVVEWWITHNRVKERLNPTRPVLTLQDYLFGGTVIVNATTVNADGFALPTTDIIEVTDNLLVLVEVPPNHPVMIHQDPDLAFHWYMHTREVLGGLLGRGYVITDFLWELDEHGRDRTFYLLSKL